MTFQSWGSICAPWQEGGFNIKELLSWNKALISKWLWLLIQGRGGVWAAWTEFYVIVDSSIWTVLSKPHFAESWRAILKVRGHLLTIAGSQQGAQAALNSCVLKGEFVVSKPYDMFRKKRRKLGWTKALICPELLPKHKVCVIQATQQVLSTLDKISARGYPMVNWCCLCERAWESHRHLLFRCSYSKNICRLMQSWLDIPGCRTDCSLKNWLYWISAKGGFRSWQKIVVTCSIAGMVYSIWEERNMRIFRGQARSHDLVAKQLQWILQTRLLVSFNSCIQNWLALK
ncbi:uncharacterized protein LOC141657241 [Silene latifolia]|uniref:uncharacterized protein LOC141657241 n=1 Tax=Silene latifolia TaxID=37657 RepID=UPI003D77D991